MPTVDIRSTGLYLFSLCWALSPRILSTLFFRAMSFSFVIASSSSWEAEGLVRPLTWVVEGACLAWRARSRNVRGGFDDSDSAAEPLFDMTLGGLAAPSLGLLPKFGLLPNDFLTSGCLSFSSTMMSSGSSEGYGCKSTAGSGCF